MTNLETAVFGGGCFWCTEAVFKMLRGVISVTPGYAGGDFPRQKYEQISTGTTGHAEVVQIKFDPAHISFENLLDIFFATHDPTTLNRQGADVGPQYRSVILFTTDEQRAIAENYIAAANNSSVAGRQIITQVEPLNVFYEAENYHHNYFAKNPRNNYCTVVINPKLQKTKEKFAALLK